MMISDETCIEANSFTALHWLKWHLAEENHDDSKILVCGGGQQILSFLQHLADCGEERNIKRVICAADAELSILTNSKFWTEFGSRIVSWRQDEYEEDIVLRTGLSARQKPISWVVDFQPSLRRLHRMFYLTSEGSRVLLFGARPVSWQWVCAPLIPALRSRQVTVEHLDSDCHYLRRASANSTTSEDLAYSSSSSCEGGR